jgi:hypothetical protein
MQVRSLVHCKGGKTGIVRIAARHYFLRSAWLCMFTQPRSGE